MHLMTNNISLEKKDFNKFAAGVLANLNKEAKKDLPAFIQDKIDEKKEKEEEKDVVKTKEQPKANEQKSEEKKQEKAEDKKQDKKEQKAEEKKQEKVEDKKQASSSKFVKIAKLSSQEKSDLKAYWSSIFPKEYVDAMLAD